MRPKIELESSPADWFIEFIGLIVLGALIVFPMIKYGELPTSIPTHFNAAGEADAYGNKSVIWVMAIIGTTMYVGLTILNRFPHVFNYPVEITDQNAERQYLLATRLMRFLKVAIAGIFFFITFGMVQTSMGLANGLSTWFLPVVFLSTLGPVGIYMWLAYRSRT